ncbi:CBM20 domain-containing protein [Pycnococcus provasolii]
MQSIREIEREAKARALLKRKEEQVEATKRQLNDERFNTDQLSGELERREKEMSDLRAQLMESHDIMEKKHRQLEAVYESLSTGAKERGILRGDVEKLNQLLSSSKDEFDTWVDDLKYLKEAIQDEEEISRSPEQTSSRREVDDDAMSDAPFTGKEADVLREEIAREERYLRDREETAHAAARAKFEQNKAAEAAQAAEQQRADHIARARAEQEARERAQQEAAAAEAAERQRAQQEAAAAAAAAEAAERQRAQQEAAAAAAAAEAAERQRAQQEAAAAADEAAARERAEHEAAAAAAEAAARERAEHAFRVKAEQEAAAAAAAEAERQRAEQEARARAEQEALAAAEAEEREAAMRAEFQRQEAEAKAKADEEARRIAHEQEMRRQEEETRARAFEEEKRQQEQLAAAKAAADEQQRVHAAAAMAAAREKAEQEAREMEAAAAAANAKLLSEQEAKQKAEMFLREQAEAKAKAEAEARQREELQAMRQQQEEDRAMAFEKEKAQQMAAAAAEKLRKIQQKAASVAAAVMPKAKAKQGADAFLRSEAEAKAKAKADAKFREELKAIRKKEVEDRAKAFEEEKAQQLALAAAEKLNVLKDKAASFTGKVTSKMESAKAEADAKAKAEANAKEYLRMQLEAKAKAEADIQRWEELQAIKNTEKEARAKAFEKEKAEEEAANAALDELTAKMEEEAQRKAREELDLLTLKQAQKQANLVDDDTMPQLPSLMEADSQVKFVSMAELKKRESEARAKAYKVAKEEADAIAAAARAREEELASLLEEQSTDRTEDKEQERLKSWDDLFAPKIEHSASAFSFDSVPPNTLKREMGAGARAKAIAEAKSAFFADPTPASPREEFNVAMASDTRMSKRQMDEEARARAYAEAKASLSTDPTPAVSQQPPAFSDPSKVTSSRMSQRQVDAEARAKAFAEAKAMRPADPTPTAGREIPSFFEPAAPTSSRMSQRQVDADARAKAFAEAKAMRPADPTPTAGREIPSFTEPVVPTSSRMSQRQMDADARAKAFAEAKAMRPADPTPIAGREIPSFFEPAAKEIPSFTEPAAPTSSRMSQRQMDADARAKAFAEAKAMRPADPTPIAGREIPSFFEPAAKEIPSFTEPAAPTSSRMSQRQMDAEARAKAFAEAKAMRPADPTPTVGREMPSFTEPATTTSSRMSQRQMDAEARAKAFAEAKAMRPADPTPTVGREIPSFFEPATATSSRMSQRQMDAEARAKAFAEAKASTAVFSPETTTSSKSQIHSQSTQSQSASERDTNKGSEFAQSSEVKSREQDLAEAAARHDVNFMRQRQAEDRAKAFAEAKQLQSAKPEGAKLNSDKNATSAISAAAVRAAAAEANRAQAEADAKAFKLEVLSIRHKEAEVRAKAFAEAKSQQLAVSPEATTTKHAEDQNERKPAPVSSAKVSATIPPNAHTVHFEVQLQCKYGDTVLICGSTEQLGNWNPDKALPLTCAKGGDMWSADIPLHDGMESTCEFKMLVRREDGSLEWERGENRGIGRESDAQASHDLPSRESVAHENLLATRQREAEARAKAFAEAKAVQLVSQPIPNPASTPKPVSSIPTSAVREQARRGNQASEMPHEDQRLIRTRQTDAEARAKAFAEAKAVQIQGPTKDAPAVSMTTQPNAHTAHFEVQLQCKYGDTVLICGSTEQLGNWNPDKALPLTCVKGGDMWSAEISLHDSLESTCEFKVLVRRANGSLEWERGENRRIGCDEESGVCEVVEDGTNRKIGRDHEPVVGDAYDIQANRAVSKSLNDALMTTRQHDAEARAKAFAEAKSQQLAVSPEATTTKHAEDQNERKPAPVSSAKVSATIPPNAHTVHFEVQLQCKYGDTVLICGSTEQLGNWNPDKALPLTCAKGGDMWSADIPLHDGMESTCEFKMLVRREDGSLEWERGENRGIGRESDAQASHDLPSRESMAHENLLATRQREAEARAKAFAEAKAVQIQGPTKDAPVVSMTTQPNAHTAHFEVQLQCKYGDTVLICGSTEQLGNWNPDKALPLTCVKGGDMWSAEISLHDSLESTCEFKVLVRRANGSLEWERGENRHIGCDEESGVCEVEEYDVKESRSAGATSMFAKARDWAMNSLQDLHAIRQKEREDRAKAFAAMKAEQLSGSRW